MRFHLLKKGRVWAKIRIPEMELGEKRLNQTNVISVFSHNETTLPKSKQKKNI